nr:amidase [Variovorax terrae]
MRQGAVTSEQAVGQYLDRIAALQPKLQAFRQVRAEQALAEARALDAERAQGHDRGPLMGVPIAVKEIIAVEGLGCSVNSRLDVSSLCPVEGPFVRALRAAGCVILGTTASTEFALATLNWEDPGPWNPVDGTVRRLCGGSSHGSAVAVAARLCAFAVGTDTGGSVRVPAALCGVAGYKSTQGVWPTDGVFPAAPSMDALGVLATSAADCAAVAHALRPHLGLAPDTPSAGSAAGLSGLRLGWLCEPDGEPLDAAVQDALGHAVERLRQAGAAVSPVAPPAAEEVARLFARRMPAEFARMLGQDRLRAGMDLLDPVTAARAAAEIDMPPAELDALARQAAQLRHLAQAQMQGYDAWLCATTPCVAGPRSALRSLDDALHWNRRIGRHTRPVNVFGQCAVSLPMPTREGLPAGLQVICGNGQDTRLLAIATAIEAVLR